MEAGRYSLAVGGKRLNQRVGYKVAEFGRYVEFADAGRLIVYEHTVGEACTTLRSLVELEDSHSL